MDLFTDIFSGLLSISYEKSAAKKPLVMIIPFALLLRLQVTKRQKHILVALFLFPMVVIVFATLRLSLLAKRFHPLSDWIDPIRLCLFSTLEISTGVYRQSSEPQKNRGSTEIC